MMPEHRAAGWLKRIPFRLIGLLLLAYVLYIVDLQEVQNRLRQMAVASVVLTVAAYLIFLGFRCCLWHVLSRTLWPEAPLRRSCYSCNEATWMGLVTPGRIGEFRRAVDLTNDSGTRLATTSALVLFDLFIELFAYAVFALAGAVLLVMGGGALAWTVYTLCLAAGVLCLVLVRWPMTMTLRWLPFVKRIPGLSNVLPALSAGLREPVAAWLALFTFGTAVGYCLMIVALTSDMRLELSLVDYLTLVGLVGVSGALPITYFGFGIREL
ncbi:MAG: lysylphosphatidylglycerol synthase transmembrane domain-containing protein, partial [Methyloligellaceae bacterium]